jgi:YD repeat-containing protein
MRWARAREPAVVRARACCGREGAGPDGPGDLSRDAAASGYRLRCFDSPFAVRLRLRVPPAFPQRADLGPARRRAARACRRCDVASGDLWTSVRSYQDNNASQLTTSPTTTYTYNPIGERTTATPTSGPAVSYSYDQAHNLTSVTPAGGTATSYTSNGAGQLQAITNGSQTSQLA